MSRHRTRARTASPASQDPTLTALRELMVLWPRLEDALARDSAGLSAGPSGGGGGAASPAVVDLDTTRARISIEAGLQDLAGQARALLNVQQPGMVIARTTKRIAQLRIERARAVAKLARVRALVLRAQAARRPAPSAALDLTRRLAATVTSTNTAIARHQANLRTAEHYRTPAGVLEQLPDWYTQLRNRQQPLAEHMATDVARWTSDAKRALGLRTHERRLGWFCPHHRVDAATELVQVADEAVLADSLMRGRRQRESEAGLRWKHARAVRCPHCREQWLPEQMPLLMRMIRTADQEAAAAGRPTSPAALPAQHGPYLLDAQALARALHRDVRQLRAWAAAGLIARHGCDDAGRAVYDVEEVIGVSQRTERRERALFRPGRSTTGVPEASAR